jgi:hypothetical protein
LCTTIQYGTYVNRHPKEEIENQNLHENRTSGMPWTKSKRNQSQILAVSNVSIGGFRDNRHLKSVIPKV